MIPLATETQVAIAAVLEELRATWPALPPLENFNQSDGAFSFRVASMDVVGSHMPAPIPWGDLEDPCRASWIGKDAEPILRLHKSHLVLVVREEGQPLECARLLTQVTASVFPACEEALGVLWVPARLLVPPSVFRDFAVNMLERPLYIWIDFRAGKRSDGLTEGFTTGMEALGHMEFETRTAPDTPGELRERFFTLANYVLDHGPVIKDGDTIGEDSAAQIRATRVHSAFGRNSDVLRLDWQSKSQKKQ